MRVARTFFLQIRSIFPLHRLALVAKTPLLVALGMYLAGGRFRLSTVSLAMGLATALWASLYVLNEATDLVIEQGDGMGRMPLAALAVLPVAICMAAFRFSPRLALYLGVMAAGQAAYCLPPLRVKRYGSAVYLLGGFVNPFLRMQCGAMWGPGRVPPAACAAMFALHVGAAIRSRALSRTRDRQLGYTAAPEGSERIGKACTAAGLAGAYALCAAGTLPPLFWGLVTAGSAYAAYAWSSAVTRRSQLRRDAAGFIVFSILAIAVLVMT